LVKFGQVCAHVGSLSNCKFYKNWCSVRNTLLETINEIMFCLSHFFLSDLDKILQDVSEKYNRCECRAIRSGERQSNIPDTQTLTVRTFVMAINKITYARVSKTS
jgi:hypothetical protein